MKVRFIKYLIMVVSMLLVAHIAHGLNCGNQCNPCGLSSGCCVQVVHSFFRSREVTPNNVFQHNLSLYWWYHDVLYKDDCIWWSMQVSPFYQRSTSGKKTAQFFFPCKQSYISVKENGTGDVGSLWLNLIAADGSSFDWCWWFI